MQNQNEKSVRMNFYCPLTAQIDDPDGFDYAEADNSVLLRHEDQVRGALLREQRLGDDLDITQYITRNQALNDKLLSAIWDIETVSDTVYGCIHLRLSEPLTAEEKVEIREGLLGQNADGLCEGVEQHPIKTSDGNLYVSFWNSGEDYFLLDDGEFEQHLSGGPQMGGYQ